MTAGSGNSEQIIKKGLQISNKIQYYEKHNKYVFINCRNVKPKEICITTSPRGPNWQIGFFDADKEVYFKKVKLGNGAVFSNLVRNYWWNGKEGSERKEGYYSLIKAVEVLEIETEGGEGCNTGEQLTEDLADYVEGRYQISKRWKRYELNKNIEVKIVLEEYSLILGTVKRLRQYFNNVFINNIWTPLQTENTIDQECGETYIFSGSRKTNPQKLIINAKLMGSGNLILFNGADSEVQIPEITIDEHGCFTAIVRNWWCNNKESDEEKCGFYSLVQYIETFTIRNNPGVLKDFADYVIGKYEIRHPSWQLQQLSRDVKVMVESLGDAFLDVLKIQHHFKFVTIDGKQLNDYIQTIEQEELKNQDYKAFKTYFEAHDLRVYPFLCSVKIQNELELINYIYNIKKSVDRIDSLTARQKLDINQFVCFHDIDKAVAVDKIVIDDTGDLRSVLQNAYYSNGEGGFFSLLKTAKNLEIRNNIQATEDLVDYVDGKYALHPKWGTQALDRNIDIKIDVMNSPDVAKRLKNYFRIVSIDCIKTPNDNEQKDNNQNLVSHVKTLTIQNNQDAVRNLNSYTYGNYKIQQYNWRVQNLSENIIIRINGVKGLNEKINRFKDYFGYIFVDDRKSIRDGRQQMLIHINSKSNDIRQRQAQNKQKQQNIDNSVTSIQNAKRRIERARARLGRRRARFQEYLALTE